jgi:hypothetical protein
MMTLKYHNKIIYADGLCFRSQLEYHRYQELQLLVHMGLIRNLKTHTRYPLIVNGVKVGVYEDDFNYDDIATKQHVVEDCKCDPTRTDAYKMKKQLMKALYNIDIIEVE